VRLDAPRRGLPAHALTRHHMLQQPVEGPELAAPVCRAQFQRELLPDFTKSEKSDA
jgi:hypothetical protein